MCVCVYIHIPTYLVHGAESFLRANCFAASQEIPRILWNPKVHYRTHKRLPPVPILGQPNPVLYIYIYIYIYSYIFQCYIFQILHTQGSYIVSFLFNIYHYSPRRNSCSFFKSILMFYFPKQNSKHTKLYASIYRV